MISTEPPDTTLIVADDPSLGAMATRILEDVSERAGMSLKSPVRVAKRSREALESYLALKLDEELTEERASHVTAVYSMLGQAPEDLDLRLAGIKIDWHANLGLRRAEIHPEERSDIRIPYKRDRAQHQQIEQPFDDAAHARLPSASFFRFIPSLFVRFTSFTQRRN